MQTNLFHATQQWIKGELLEGIIVALFGILTIGMAVALWQYGKSPAARSLVIPVLLCGMAYTGIGLSLYLNNRGAEARYEQTFRANPTEFAVKEKSRVEGFGYMYVISKTVATVAFLSTLLIFWFSTSPTWQGIGIGLSLFGLAGLAVDFFSQHRAEAYYRAILAALP